MSDLHDEDAITLDRVDHAIVADAQATTALEAVLKRLTELDGVDRELALDGSANTGTRRLGKRGDVLSDDALLRFAALSESGSA